MNPREGALRVLFQIHTKEAYSNLALNQELKENPYNQQEKALMTELIYGVLENQIYLDFVIKKFSSTKIKKIHPMTLNLLRIGIYQILLLDKIPVSAAVNESVKLAKKYAKNASGFVNGILRTVSRESHQIQLPDPLKMPVEYLSVAYSHPEWLVEFFLKDYDFQFVEELLAANNQAPPLFLRVNTLKISVEDCVAALKAASLQVEKSEILNEALLVKGVTHLSALSLLQEGKVYIQDLASMLISHVVSPQEGELVIDVCSAPGGKATHMAQLMNNRGNILARDVYPHKVELIEKNGARLGAGIVKGEVFDALTLDERLIQKADRVLVDAPCSGLGILRRKPEIKYRKSPEDLQSLTRLQEKILKQAAAYVKDGGTLVYSTCTINPAENDQVVENFLIQHPAFKLVNLGEQWSEKLPGPAQGETIKLFPHLHGTDGFFIAKMQRGI